MIPEEWSIGIIIPIYKKKGDINDPDNYRGITLLSCLAKVFTSVLNNRLTEFLEDFKIIGEEQAGFRKGYSTTDHIFSLYCIISLYLNCLKKNLYCGFIDYRKAFDSVRHQALWQKLLGYNINGKILNVISNIYENAKSCIRLNNEFSRTFPCNIGVRQGDNLSPLLFALFINDLEKFLAKAYNGLPSLGNLVYSHLENEDTVTYLKLFLLLYADDTILFAESAEELQASLYGLQHYCNIWKLDVNVDKTKIMIFSKSKHKAENYNFQYNSKEVELVHEFKYLGIVFSYNCNFKNCISHQIKQANKAMFGLISKIRNFDLDIDVQLDLFYKTIVPILLYGCEVWGFSSIKDIEKVQLKFCKIMLKVNKSTTTAMVLGELGLFPLAYEVNKRMLCYWYRCQSRADTSSKLSVLFCQLAQNMYCNNKFALKWVSRIKEVLSNCKLLDHWNIELNINNFHRFKHMCKQNLSTYYSIEWKLSCNEGKKHNLYKDFKNDIVLEEYLLKLPKVLRYPLCRFRVSNHFLPIEKGRHENTPRNERTCSLCNKDELGDEFHYLLECKFFENERKLYIPKFYCIKPSAAKYIQLMSTTNFKTLCKLAKFVNIILKYFKSN
jgi:hypothetical protein